MWMNDWVTHTPLNFLCLLVYLVASIPTGLIWGFVFGKNLRKIGSGNVGASNAYRAGGFKLGFLIAVCDMLKGVFAVYILKDYGNLGMLIGVLGQVFPIFAKFKGGKGVATYLGSLMMLANMGWLFIPCWLIITYLFSLPFLASLLVILSSIFILKFDYYLIFTLILILYKHRKNLQNALSFGSER
jgi:glycerol-3-phosphate acyltransferase PlsY